MGFGTRVTLSGGSICLSHLLLSLILVVLNRHLSFIFPWWPRCIALEHCLYNLSKEYSSLQDNPYINDITGPAAGLISYVSSEWHTVISSYTPGKCFFGVNPFYNGVLYSLR